MKVQSKPIEINNIQVHAPTAESTDEGLESLYDSKDTARKQHKHVEVTVVTGDF